MFNLSCLLFVLSRSITRVLFCITLVIDKLILFRNDTNEECAFYSYHWCSWVLTLQMFLLTGLQKREILADPIAVAVILIQPDLMTLNEAEC